MFRCNAGQLAHAALRGVQRVCPALQSRVLRRNLAEFALAAVEQLLDVVLGVLLALQVVSVALLLDPILLQRLQ